MCCYIRVSLARKTSFRGQVQLTPWNAPVWTRHASCFSHRGRASSRSPAPSRQPPPGSPSPRHASPLFLSASRTCLCHLSGAFRDQNTYRNRGHRDTSPECWGLSGAQSGVNGALWTLRTVVGSSWDRSPGEQCSGPQWDREDTGVR